MTSSSSLGLIQWPSCLWVGRCNVFLLDNLQCQFMYGCKFMNIKGTIKQFHFVSIRRTFIMKKNKTFHTSWNWETIWRTYWNHVAKLVWKVNVFYHMGRAKRIWYLSPMRAAKVQASLRIRAVSPEPSLLAHTSSESRRTFRQKARSLAPLNGWACAVKICHDGMLEDTNSLGGAHMTSRLRVY